MIENILDRDSYFGICCFHIFFVEKNYSKIRLTVLPALSRLGVEDLMIDLSGITGCTSCLGLMRYSSDL